MKENQKVSFNDASTLGLLFHVGIASQKTHNFGKVSRDVAMCVHEIEGANCFMSFVPPLQGANAEQAPACLTNNPDTCEHSGAIYQDSSSVHCTACGKVLTNV